MSNNKSEFSRLKNIHYLDHAGAGLYTDLQIDIVAEYLKNNLLGNPHSLSLCSKYCHDVVDQARNRILKHFCTNEDEYSVVFTSGSTSGLKLVVEWFDWEQDRPNEVDGHLVYLRDNHTSVLGLREIAVRKKAQIHCLNRDDAFVRFRESIPNSNQESKNGRGLFIYPAMCNFSGCKYPLDWIKELQNNALDIFVDPKGYYKGRIQWYCLLDAAAFVPTNKLDLSIYKPDFVVFSFYKMFGYPTGLGALLIKNSSRYVLKKTYYGGGTILMALSDALDFVGKPTLHEWCEDGTINYLSIASLRHGFDELKRLGGDMNVISDRVFEVTRYLHDKLITLHHSNGSPAVKIYHDTDYSDTTIQGGIINFNILRCTGEYVGYLEVLHVANSFGIYLRTGCFCNPGACQRHLNLSQEIILRNFQKGHTCADNIDLIDGYPTGSIRVSFGYISDHLDADALINMIIQCFLVQPVVNKIPNEWPEHSRILRSNFGVVHTENNHTIIPKVVVKGLTKELKKKSIFECKTTFPIPIKAKLKMMFVYPVKSCGAFSVLKSWQLDKTGLKYDRHWMIVSEDGVVLTQKQLPRMCLIIPEIDLEKGIMYLKFGYNKSSVPLEEKEDTNIVLICNSKVCSDRVQVIDCGNEIAEWLQKQLNVSGIRLVKLLSRNKKDCLSEDKSSGKWLRDQCSSLKNAELSNMLQRFRSNFILTCDGAPFQEFMWNEIQIGSVNFQIEGPCQRCQMICIDQTTGERNREPLLALSTAFKGKIKFGVYLKHKNCVSSILSINDSATPIINI